MPPASPNISQIFLISALLMMILVGLIIFFVLVYQKRLIRQQMHLQALKAEHQRKLLSATIETQEKERKRIARDLHDEIGAMLSALKLQVNQFSRQMKEVPQAVSFSGQTHSLLTEAIQQVRQISHDLLPPLLERFGLGAAIKGILTRLEDESQLQTLYRVVGGERRIATTKELALYRVVQELIQNTLKHAAASQIQIQLTYLDDQLQLVYTDNGKGFEVETLLQAGGGLGLSNMESRVSAIAGELSFSSTPGEGTRVEIQIPLTATLSLEPTVT